jgi:hypothetical protein
MADSRAIMPTDFAGAENHILGEDTTEHIYLGDESGTDAENHPKTVAEKFALNDRLRRTVTEITLYNEGFLKLVKTRHGKRTKPFLLDLRYLDPVPSLDAHYPKHLIKGAAVAAVVAVVAALIAQIDVLSAFAYPAAGLATLTMLALVGLFAYLSHERVVYRTLHGRAAALRLVAGLGYMRRFRRVMPKIIRAIEQAEENIGDDTAIYLRAEMREHYRLRGDGVLSAGDCSESTGRILTHFDDEM